MGTRASIIVRNRVKKQTLFRQFDGYPSSTGVDLGLTLDKFQEEEVDMDAFIGALTSHQLYSVTDKIEPWAAYVYIVDLADRCVFGYAVWDIRAYFNTNMNDWTDCPFDAMPHTKMCWFYHSDSDEDEQELCSNRCSDHHNRIKELSRTADPFGELVRIAANIPCHVEYYYSKHMDHCLDIYRRGTGPNGEDEKIVNLQHCDFAYVCYRALAALMDYSSEHCGGY